MTRQRKSTDLPAALTRGKIQIIEREMRAGVHREHAAVLADIKPASLRDWVQVGRENPGTPLGDLADRLDRAWATHVAKLAKRVASSKDVKASMWDLERAARAQYHLPTRIILEQEREQLVAAFEDAAAEVVTDAGLRTRLLARTHALLASRLGDGPVGGAGSNG